MHEGTEVGGSLALHFYLRFFFFFFFFFFFLYSSHLLTRIISNSSKNQSSLEKHELYEQRRREIYQIGVKDGRRLSFSNPKISVELCLLVMVIIISRTQ